MPKVVEPAPDPDFDDAVPLAAPVAPAPAPAPAAPAEEEKKEDEDAIAEWWYLSGHEKIEKGPVTVSRLSTLLKRGLISDTTEVRSEQGSYAPLNSIRQLRWQLLMEGTSYLEPVACALTVLDIIILIVNRHSSYAAEGILKTPIPRAKRVFGQRKYLTYIAQLMLVNNPTLVENAASVLDTITENNEDAMNKLYLTGVFFFAMAYSGSNFLKISTLLSHTHLKQFRTSADSLTTEVPISKRSILGTILPESMICLLDNYGPEEFTKKLLGNFDTPEVIWKYEMRKHMVEEVLKHIGDFSKKLRENPTLLFDYGHIGTSTRCISTSPHSGAIRVSRSLHRQRSALDQPRLRPEEAQVYRYVPFTRLTSRSHVHLRRTRVPHVEPGAVAQRRRDVGLFRRHGLAPRGGHGARRLLRGHGHRRARAEGHEEGQEGGERANQLRAVRVALPRTHPRRSVGPAAAI